MQNQSIAELLPLYDAYIVDLWGVVHNGQAAFPEALEVLKALKAAGKKVLLLSNAPRRVASAAEQLIERGVPPELYDIFYTSGEDCHRALKERTHPWYQKLGNNLYHLGPDKDKSLLEEVTFTIVDDLEKADFILNTGVLTWECCLADYEALLKQAHVLKLPMACANPDKVVLFKGKNVICAGELATYFERLGGEVFYHGKPYPEFYTAACELLDNPNPSKILAIGDSLMTDIKGAHLQGIDSLFIRSGIHAGAEDLETLFAAYSVRPTYIADRLVLKV